MFKLLFNFHLLILGLLIYSWISLFFKPAGSFDGRPLNKRNTVWIIVLFGAIAAIIWYLQKSGNASAAGYTLYGFYGLGVCWLIWLMRTATWR